MRSLTGSGLPFGSCWLARCPRGFAADINAAHLVEQREGLDLVVTPSLNSGSSMLFKHYHVLIVCDTQGKAAVESHLLEWT